MNPDSTGISVLFAMTSWLMILCLAAGCGSPSMSVQTDPVPTHAFGGMHSYYWEPRPQTGEARIDSDENLHALIQSEVDLQLQKKGYHRVNGNEADFAVTYSGELERTSTTKAWRSQYRPRLTLGNPGTVNYVEDRGRLTLIFLQPDSGRTLWQGSARDKLDPSVKQTDTDRKQLKEAIQKILANIPNATH